jgi:hypothetical protein
MSDLSYDRLRDDYLQARKEAHDTSLTMNKFMLLICAGTGSLFITIAFHSERLLVFGAPASLLCLVAAALYYWAMCESLRVSLADQLVNRIRMEREELLSEDTLLEKDPFLKAMAKLLGYKDKVLNQTNYMSFIMGAVKKGKILSYLAIWSYVLGVLVFCVALVTTKS